MTPEPNLSGRRILVTGASRGIGRAVAVMAAAGGARIAVHYGRDAAAADATLAALDGDGHCTVGADLGDPVAAAGLADAAAGGLGGLDGVVNNAGIFTHHDLTTGGDGPWLEIWQRTLAVNLTGPAQVIGGAVAHLERAGGGHIVNITSRGAYRGEPQAPAYGASKAGLNSLSQSLALALAPRRITVVAVAPGWVLTDMTREHLAGAAGDAIRNQSPMGRTATDAEIAEVVLLALSGRADALSGAVIDVNCASYLR